jgi:hypothetical protein
MTGVDRSKPSTLASRELLFCFSANWITIKHKPSDASRRASLKDSGPITELIQTPALVLHQKSQRGPTCQRKRSVNTVLSFATNHEPYGGACSP